jgi:hypothetical protein
LRQRGLIVKLLEFTLLRRAVYCLARGRFFADRPICLEVPSILGLGCFLLVARRTTHGK